MTKDLIKLEKQRQKAIAQKKYDKQYKILLKQMSLRAKERIIQRDKIAELIEIFVSNNFNADGCKECHIVGHEIIPNDFKGSYDVALDEFIRDLKKVLK